MKQKLNANNAMWEKLMIKRKNNGSKEEKEKYS